jgi:hypothetical protein
MTGTLMKDTFSMRSYLNRLFLTPTLIAPPPGHQPVNAQPCEILSSPRTSAKLRKPLFFNDIHEEN